MAGKRGREEPSLYGTGIVSVDQLDQQLIECDPAKRSFSLAWR